jgi:hypothetical protein
MMVFTIALLLVLFLTMLLFLTMKLILFVMFGNGGCRDGVHGTGHGNEFITHSLSS